MIEFYHALIFSFCCAVISFVYCVVLTEPHMIFAGLYRTLSKIAGSQFVGIDWDDVKFVFRTRDPMKVWWFKIIIGCERCNSGQIALWAYLAYSLKKSLYEADLFQAIGLHLFTVCATIYLAIILTKFYRWLN